MSDSVTFLGNLACVILHIMPKDSFKNTLWTGDNLYILNGMNNESVDLIYLDPPFNSKRSFSAPIGSKAAGASFKDMWSWQDVDEYYLEKLLTDYPFMTQFVQAIEGIHGKAMMSYITYMTQRLIEMHRILKPTGSIYLHCDPTASHYLKIIMDRIFGKNNFRNEIVWQRNDGRGKGSQFGAKKFGANTDTILFYTKSDSYFFNANKKSQDDNVKFNKTDEKGNKYYTGIPIFRSKSMGDRPNLCYKWRGFENPHPSGWRLSKERLEEEYQKGNIVITKNNKLERRKYMKDYSGEPIDNNWTDIPRAIGKENTGYPTQKPLALLRRIVEASSKPGDIVLDPFCGCATTCVAAQQLERKWIGIDIEKKAAQVLIDRLTDNAGIFSDFVHRTDTPQRTDVKTIKPTLTTKEKLFKEQKGICNACKTEFEIRHFEIDHIIPKSKGGGDYYENYQLLCGSCNRIKGDKPMEYLKMKVGEIEKKMKTEIGFD